MIREIKKVWAKKEGATKNNRSLINQTYSYENKIKIVLMCVEITSSFQQYKYRKVFYSTKFFFHFF